MTATARPVDRPGVARRAEDREPVGVAQVVAEGHDRRRPELRQQALERPRACRRRSAAGGRRPAGRGSGRARAPAARGRRSSMAATTAARAGDPVVGLADVERDRRALALDEQPGRPAEHLGDARWRAVSAGSTRRLVAGRGTSSRGGTGGRRRANVPALQAVVAEIARCRRRGPAPRRRPRSGRSGSRRSAARAGRRRRGPAGAGRAGRAARWRSRPGRATPRRACRRSRRRRAAARVAPPVRRSRRSRPSPAATSVKA